LRVAHALREAGFTVERPEELGYEWMVYGFGQAALKKKLESCVKSLRNKLRFAANEAGSKALESIIKEYEEGNYK
jgi:hypothetical protein